MEAAKKCLKSLFMYTYS